MDIKEIEDQLSKVTPGPWEFILVDNVLITNDKNHGDACEIAENFGHVYDAEFVAKSPDYVRYLLAIINQLREERDSAQRVGIRTMEQLRSAESERDKYREALEAISRGLFSTRNAQAVAQSALKE